MLLANELFGFSDGEVALDPDCTKRFRKQSAPAIERRGRRKRPTETNKDDIQGSRDGFAATL